MLFLISFVWLVAASFAFALAILTPNWFTFISSPLDGNAIVQRGVFYVCNLLQSDNNYMTNTQCVSVIGQQSSTNSYQWIYQYATASASLAIACAGLSIIALCLSGVYFHVRKRTDRALCGLLSLSLLIFVIFCTSFVVWILLISETIKLGISIDRNMFNWPMWVAVGATGGYLMSFLTMLFSFCALYRHQSKRKNNYYQSRNQF